MCIRDSLVLCQFLLQDSLGRQEFRIESHHAVITPVSYTHLYKVGGLFIDPAISYPVGIIVGLGLFVLFITKVAKHKS